MGDSLKQRLIGAVLLLSVVIVVAIFLVKSANNGMEGSVETIQPDFVSSINTEQEDIAAVEPEVLLDPHRLATPSKPEKHDSVKQAEPITERKKDKPVEPVSKQTDPKPAAENKTKSAGPQWLIQLASFSKQENAKILQQKVTKLGMQAHIEPVVKNNMTNYRVRIGPESDREKVDQLVKTISQSLALKPQVLTVKAD